MFHIENRSKNLPNPATTFMWELHIPNINDILGSYENEGFIVRCRSVSIPSRTTEPIETFFLGHKKTFSGRTQFSNIINVLYEETEDLYITKSLYNWMEKIESIDPEDSERGTSKSYLQKNLNSDLFLFLYGYNKRKLDKKIRFHNARPQSLDEVNLDYTDNSAIKFSVNFHFDFWSLV